MRPPSDELDWRSSSSTEPVVAVHGQPFVIREESPPTTVGGGRVLHPSAEQRVRRRDRSEIARLKQLASHEPQNRMAAAMAKSGFSSWTEPALCRESGVSIHEVEATVERLHVMGSLVTIPVGPRRNVRVLPEVVEELEARVLRAIARLHEASPRFSAIARSRVASSLDDLENSSIVDSNNRTDSSQKVRLWLTSVSSRSPATNRG